MRNFNISPDLTPLYRSAIGFDRLAQLAEHAAANNANTGYPPYNIELLGENRYRITMAVAGFDRTEINIEMNQNLLTVGANKETEPEAKTYLHQGIAARSFERRFQLADHVQVLSANYENGLLHIELQRIIPESMKPRRIEIGTETAKATLQAHTNKVTVEGVAA